MGEAGWRVLGLWDFGPHTRSGRGETGQAVSPFCFKGLLTRGLGPGQGLGVVGESRAGSWEEAALRRQRC